MLISSIKTIINQTTKIHVCRRILGIKLWNRLISFPIVDALLIIVKITHPIILKNNKIINKGKFKSRLVLKHCFKTMIGIHQLSLVRTNKHEYIQSKYL